MKKQTNIQPSRKAADRREARVSTHTNCSHKCQRILLGVDTHGGHYVSARKADHGPNQPPQKMPADQFLDYLRRQLTLADEVILVYEAGPYSFALARQANAIGVRCLVCAPERLDRGRRRVNDKIDARELLNRLDRYLSGNRDALHIVRIPSIHEEISRRRVRERAVYRKERQRWISRGRSLLHTLGIARPGRWWKPARLSELLALLRGQYEATIVDDVADELQRHWQMVQTMENKLKELTAKLEEEHRQKSTEPRLRGMGPVSFEALEREIGDWNRFGNRRQIASYTGLCPGEDSTGESRRLLSIDKHGNPRVRHVLVELAWLLPRYQPHYIRLERWRATLGKPGAARKKAIVALARQFAVDYWRLRTGRMTAAELGLLEGGGEGHNHRAPSFCPSPPPLTVAG